MAVTMVRTNRVPQPPTSFKKMAVMKASGTAIECGQGDLLDGAHDRLTHAHVAEEVWVSRLVEGHRLVEESDREVLNALYDHPDHDVEEEPDDEGRTRSNDGGDDAIGGGRPIDGRARHNPVNEEEEGVPAEDVAERAGQQRQLVEEDPNDRKRRQGGCDQQRQTLCPEIAVFCVAVECSEQARF